MERSKSQVDAIYANVFRDVESLAEEEAALGRALAVSTPPSSPKISTGKADAQILYTNLCEARNTSYRTCNSLREQLSEAEQRLIAARTALKPVQTAVRHAKVVFKSCEAANNRLHNHIDPTKN